MNVKITTHLLKSFDSDQNDFIVSTIDFISKAQKIENQVNIIDGLNKKLLPDEFLIIYIDELFIEQITQNTVSQAFFLKKEFRNNQIILILDDIELQQLPEYLQYFHTFNIVNLQSNSDDSNETWNNHDDTKSQLFDVLNDIVLYIKRVKTGQSKESLTVYIGPSDDNTTFEYQKITRELLHRDFRIVPEISNPSAKELIDNNEYFKDLLESADLSIHFIGHKSILRYPEQNSSALKINNIAADFCSTPDGELLQRIIYIPNEQQEGNELLQQKILQFKSDTHSLKNAELVQTPVEKFKEVVLQKLNELLKPFSQSTQLQDQEDDIYLIYPPGYEKEVQPYVEWLKTNKLKYSESQIKLDQLELLNYHQNKMTTCKGVIIYNNGNKQWFDRKLSDIKKSPGWGRKNPFKLKAICGLPPELEENNNSSFLIIDNTKELDSNKFNELLFN